MTSDEALEFLASQAGIHFDPEVVARFTEMIHSGMGAANTSLLSTGSLENRLPDSVA